MNIDSFISRQYEETINRKMLYYDFLFPENEVLSYIDDICSIPIEQIVDYILNLPTPEIDSKDVFQFSNFEDATTRLCKKLIEIDNPGLKHIDIGKLLLDDGKYRNDLAYAKYGENHAKTGTAIDLLQELSKTYFLSCIGAVFPKLNISTRHKLIPRLLLRNNFIIRLMQVSQNGSVNMRQFLYMLSDSTYTRRISNVKLILRVLAESDEYDFNELIDGLIFDTKL